MAPSVLSEIDKRAALAAGAPEEIEAATGRHARTSLEALVKVLLHDDTSETARISAANEVLDRGYGKPSVDVGGDQLLPFFGTAPAKNVGKEVREEARRYAALAIETLRKIVHDGVSASARVQAAKSMLNRAIGTVAAAKVPDALVAPAGKKEIAKRQAEQAASGMYETPPAPRATERMQ